MRAQYAVCFLQYALSNKLGVIECLGFESLASTLNHELSTINSQLKSLILVLGSFLFPLSSRSKNHPDPSSPTKGHPSGGGEYPVVLRRWGNDRTVVCLLSFLFSLSSFLYKKTSKLFPKQTKNTRVFPSFGGVAFWLSRNDGVVYFG